MEAYFGLLRACRPPSRHAKRELLHFAFAIRCGDTGHKDTGHKALCPVSTEQCYLKVFLLEADNALYRQSCTLDIPHLAAYCNLPKDTLREPWLWICPKRSLGSSSDCCIFSYRSK